MSQDRGPDPQAKQLSTGTSNCRQPGKLVVAKQNTQLANDTGEQLETAEMVHWVTTSPREEIDGVDEEILALVSEFGYAAETILVEHLLRAFTLSSPHEGTNIYLGQRRFCYDEEARTCCNERSIAGAPTTACDATTAGVPFEVVSSEWPDVVAEVHWEDGTCQWTTQTLWGECGRRIKISGNDFASLFELTHGFPLTSKNPISRFLNSWSKVKRLEADARAVLKSCLI